MFVDVGKTCPKCKREWKRRDIVVLTETARVEDMNSDSARGHGARTIKVNLSHKQCKRS